jgi:hypothetical protein
VVPGASTASRSTDEDREKEDIRLGLEEGKDGREEEGSVTEDESEVDVDSGTRG